ncbi:hypothetical protein CABS01_06065 [Colletotrichum abscissum]|uniref:uncharacterized protein n=1 Tax=Colletotrichum abscissum TaxID=1671311 RepID=UPI0027D496C0|nr:uncharacterized protein CABS01_06065 [Colletotrichum abscissum]KAK1518531.1 hypothetical protein CABS01_06065 [Colletotrichum abscissum]
MASTITNSENIGKRTADITISDVPDSTQNNAANHQKDIARLPEHFLATTDNLAGNDVAELVEVVQGLQRKVLELETKAKPDPEKSQEEGLPPELKADLERHRKMEACLYKHRKEWEATEDPGDWGIEDSRPRGYMQSNNYQRRWRMAWAFHRTRRFDPPDHFHPSHECLSGQADVPGQDIDDFDRTIDFGSRRDRLRKTFEWEMDRLYLAEELERRRHDEVLKPGEKVQNDSDPPEEDDHQEEDTQPIYALAKLNRLQWFSFSKLSGLGEKDACVMDILVGEPDIAEDLGAYRLWYGYSGHSVPKTDAPQESDALASTSPGDSPLPERIRIHSAALFQILGTLLGRTLHTRTESTVIMIRPFKALTFCEPRLRDWCTALENKFGVASGSGSAATVAAGNMDILARLKHLNTSDPCKVFFSDLWHIFRPGTEVINKDGKQAYRVIKVTSARHSVARDWGNYYSLPETKRKKKAAFSVVCIHIDFDGKHLGPVRSVFDMKRFDGARDITSLDVYPLRFHPIRRVDFSNSEWSGTMSIPPHQRCRTKLVNRGSKFLEVASVKHMYYAGPTLGVRDEVESQVVIDFETAFTVENGAQKQWKPHLETLIGVSTTEENEEDEEDEKDESCRAACCRREAVHDDSFVDEKQSSEYVDSLLPKAGSLNEQLSVAVIPRPLEELYSDTGETLISDDDLLIMSHRVFGFVLRNRKWAQLDLSYLTDVHRPEKSIASEENPEVLSNEEKKEPITAFDRLVLEKWHRPMIESLIAQHFRDKKSATGEREEFDIVKGKGKGLIMLLHGAPGVGKTSTAEGVAELFKKPLFQITCGDLGTTASEVEKALEMNFALANRWDCILLLDEADVFLAERTKEDFRRNGLVAVFLRVMEYYAGILFLTTNRVGDFDEAFTSRIHVSLLYRELNKEKTIEVFRINLDMIEARFKRKGRIINVDKAEIERFASEHFTDYSSARWNGRQIRNACQTALALAEYDAHDKSHSVAPIPRTAVALDVSHFKIVRDAYVEFTEYMNDLYKVDSAQRAMDNQLRAVWVDKDNKIVPPTSMGGTVRDQKKANFLRASQSQSFVNHPQQSPPPPPVHQQHYSQPQQQQPQYYHYQNLNMPQPVYSETSYGQPQSQSYSSGQVLGYSGVPVANPPFQGSGEEGGVMAPTQQIQRPSLATPPHQPLSQQNAQQVINRGVQSMYESPSQQPPNRPY